MNYPCSLAAKLLCCKCIDVAVSNPQNIFNTELSDEDYNRVVDHIYASTNVKLNKKVCGKFCTFDNYATTERQLAADNLLILLSDYDKLFRFCGNSCIIHTVPAKIKLPDNTILFTCVNHSCWAYGDPLLNLECSNCIIYYLKAYNLLKQIHESQWKAKYLFVLMYDLVKQSPYRHTCDPKGMKEFLNTVRIRYSIEYDINELIGNIFL